MLIDVPLSAPLPAGEVSELADEHDLGSCAERRGSSSLFFPIQAGKED